MNSSNHFSSSSLPQPSIQEGNLFLHELHCIGSLPSVLKHFTEATGWRLTYHCADSAPYFLRNREVEGQPVSLTEKGDCVNLPTELSPKILEEMASEGDVWIPIDIKSEFHELLHLPGPGLDEIFMQSPDEKCRSLEFLNFPIGFLHLFRDTEQKTLKNPSTSPFHGGLASNMFMEMSSDLYPQREISFREAYLSASSIRDFIAEMQVMRVHLWLMEIDGAVNSFSLENCTPLQNAEFAGRFSQLLDYACKSLKMEAIGIYFFDAKKQIFKLRASSGLPLDSLTHAIRSLEEAQADWRVFHLKNILTLDSETLTPEFSHIIPEGFSSGICCPLETNGVCFGCVWFLSSKSVIPETVVPFAEIASELLATTLEREALLRRHVRSMEYHGEMKEAAWLQEIQNPIQLPKQDNFDLAGVVRASRTVRNPYSVKQEALNIPSVDGGEKLQEAQLAQNTLREKAVSGDFYDWVKLPNGRTLMVLGSVGISGLQGAILAGSVRTAIRAHAQHCVSATEIMKDAHHTLWHQFAGNARISLFCGVVNLEGRFLAVHFAHAGALRGMKILGKGKFEPISMNRNECQYFLGGSTQFHCFEDSLYLEPKQALVVFHDGLRPYWKPECCLESSKTAPEIVKEQAENNVEILKDLVMEDLFHVTPNVRTGEFNPVLSELDKAREHMVNQEIGRLLSIESNPTAQLMVSHVRNYFCRHVTLPGKDQSAIAVRYEKSK